MKRTFIALICLINFAFCYDKDNLAEAKYFATLISESLSKNLPQKIDRVTTIVSVSHFENKATLFTLVKEYDESIQLEAKNSIIRIYCTDKTNNEIDNYCTVPSR